MGSESLTTYSKTARSKVIAAVTLIAFLITSIINPGMLRAQIPVTPLQPTITIPPTAGTIQTTYTNDATSPLIIHIQDAHLNYEAQKNISALIESLHTQGAIDRVYIEGLRGELNTSLIGAFPIEDIKKAIVDRYMKQGDFTGAEGYAMCAQNPIHLIGVDNEKLYLENIACYNEASAVKDRAHGTLTALAASLRDSRTTILNESLRSVIDHKEAFLNHSEDALTYTRFLIETAQKNTVALEAFPHFQKLSDLNVYQAKIDSEAVHSETRALIDTALIPVVNAQDSDRLALAEIDFAGGRMGAYQYYGLLKELALSYDIDFRAYENINRYFHYLTLVNDIDATKLMQDREALEKALIKKLAGNPEERMLLKRMEHARVLTEVMNLTATPEDLRYFRSNEKEITLLLPSEDRASIGVFAKFYKLAEGREDSFIRESLRDMKHNKQRVSVLLTGGYHTAGIEKLFKDHGVSYMVVSPRLTELPTDNLYDKVMRSYDKYFGVKGERAGTVTKLTELVPSTGAYKEEYLKLVAEIIPELERELGIFLEEKSAEGVLAKQEIRDLLSDKAAELFDRIVNLKQGTISTSDDKSSVFNQVVAQEIITTVWNAQVMGRSLVFDGKHTMLIDPSNIKTFIENRTTVTNETVQALSEVPVPDPLELKMIELDQARQRAEEEAEAHQAVLATIGEKVTERKKYESAYSAIVEAVEKVLPGAFIRPFTTLQYKDTAINGDDVNRQGALDIVSGNIVEIPMGKEVDQKTLRFTWSTLNVIIPAASVPQALRDAVQGKKAPADVKKALIPLVKELLAGEGLHITDKQARSSKLPINKIEEVLASCDIASLIPVVDPTGQLQLTIPFWVQATTDSYDMLNVVNTAIQAKYPRTDAPSAPADWYRGVTADSTNAALKALRENNWKFYDDFRKGNMGSSALLQDLLKKIHPEDMITPETFGIYYDEIMGQAASKNDSAKDTGVAEYGKNRDAFLAQLDSVGILFARINNLLMPGFDTTKKKGVVVPDPVLIQEALSLYYRVNAYVNDLARTYFNDASMMEPVRMKMSKYATQLNKALQSTTSLIDINGPTAQEVLIKFLRDQNIEISAQEEANLTALINGYKEDNYAWAYDVMQFADAVSEETFVKAFPYIKVVEETRRKLMPSDRANEVVDGTGRIATVAQVLRFVGDMNANEENYVTHFAIRTSAIKNAKTDEERMQSVLKTVRGMFNDEVVRNAGLVLNGQFLSDKLDDDQITFVSGQKLNAQLDAVTKDQIPCVYPVNIIVDGVKRGVIYLIDSAEFAAGLTSQLKARGETYANIPRPMIVVGEHGEEYLFGTATDATPGAVHFGDQKVLAAYNAATAKKNKGESLSDADEKVLKLAIPLLWQMYDVEAIEDQFASEEIGKLSTEFNRLRQILTHIEEKRVKGSDAPITIDPAQISKLLLLRGFHAVGENIDKLLKVKESGVQFVTPTSCSTNGASYFLIALVMLAGHVMSMSGPTAHMYTSGDAKDQEKDPAYIFGHLNPKDTGAAKGVGMNVFDADVETLEAIANYLFGAIRTPAMFKDNKHAVVGGSLYTKLMLRMPVAIPQDVLVSYLDRVAQEFPDMLRMFKPEDKVDGRYMWDKCISGQQTGSILFADLITKVMPDMLEMFVGYDNEGSFAFKDNEVKMKLDEARKRQKDSVRRFQILESMKEMVVEAAKVTSGSQAGQEQSAVRSSGEREDMPPQLPEDETKGSGNLAKMIGTITHRVSDLQEGEVDQTVHTAIRRSDVSSIKEDAYQIIKKYIASDKKIETILKLNGINTKQLIADMEEVGLDYLVCDIEGVHSPALVIKDADNFQVSHVGSRFKKVFLPKALVDAYEEEQSDLLPVLLLRELIVWKTHVENLTRIWTNSKKDYKEAYKEAEVIAEAFAEKIEKELLNSDLDTDLRARVASFIETYQKKFTWRASEIEKLEFTEINSDFPYGFMEKVINVSASPRNAQRSLEEMFNARTTHEDVYRIVFYENRPIAITKENTQTGRKTYKVVEEAIQPIAETYPIENFLENNPDNLRTIDVLLNDYAFLKKRAETALEDRLCMTYAELREWIKIYEPKKKEYKNKLRKLEERILTADSAVKTQLEEQLKSLQAEFADFQKKDPLTLAGGKGKSLSQTDGIEGVAVPAGMNVTTNAYFNFMAENPAIKEIINNKLRTLDVTNAELRDTITREIREAMLKVELPTELRQEIIILSRYLGIRPKAVRSSGIKEDIHVKTWMPISSGSQAGQSDTLLNVRGGNNIVNATKRIMASLFTDRAVNYRDLTVFQVWSGEMGLADKAPKKVFYELLEKFHFYADKLNKPELNQIADTMTRFDNPGSVNLLEALRLLIDEEPENEMLHHCLTTLEESFDDFVNAERIAIDVVVMNMVQSYVSGVLFTVDPATKFAGVPQALWRAWNEGDTSLVFVDENGVIHGAKPIIASFEVSYGYGENVVGGKVTPDKFLLATYDGINWFVVEKSKGTKTIKMLDIEKAFTLLKAFKSEDEIRTLAKSVGKAVAYDEVEKRIKGVLMQDLFGQMYLKPASEKESKEEKDERLLQIATEIATMIKEKKSAEDIQSYIATKFFVEEAGRPGIPPARLKDKIGVMITTVESAKVESQQGLDELTTLMQTESAAHDLISFFQTIWTGQEQEINDLAGTLQALGFDSSTEYDARKAKDLAHLVRTIIDDTFTANTETSKAHQIRYCITDQVATRIAQLGWNITTQLFKRPMDVEFAIEVDPTASEDERLLLHVLDGEGNVMEWKDGELVSTDKKPKDATDADMISLKLYNVQARPYTAEITEVDFERKRTEVNEKFIEDNNIKPIASGTKGENATHAYVVKFDPSMSIAEHARLIDRLKKGKFTDEEREQITRLGFDPSKYSEKSKEKLPIALYLTEADPSHDPLMQKVDAVITIRGGDTCHAAIFCREQHIPAVTAVGELKMDGEFLKTGDGLTVDANNGNIYKLGVTPKTRIPIEYVKFRIKPYGVPFDMKKEIDPVTGKASWICVDEDGFRIPKTGWVIAAGKPARENTPILLMPDQDGNSLTRAEFVGEKVGINIFAGYGYDLLSKIKNGETSEPQRILVSDIANALEKKEHKFAQSLASELWAYIAENDTAFFEYIKQLYGTVSVETVFRYLEAFDAERDNDVAKLGMYGLSGLDVRTYDMLQYYYGVLQRHYNFDYNLVEALQKHSWVLEEITEKLEAEGYSTFKEYAGSEFYYFYNLMGATIAPGQKAKNRAYDFAQDKIRGMIGSEIEGMCAWPGKNPLVGLRGTSLEIEGVNEDSVGNQRVLDFLLGAVIDADANTHNQAWFNVFVRFPRELDSLEKVFDLVLEKKGTLPKQIGIMIEVPSDAMFPEELGQKMIDLREKYRANGVELTFFSFGTNDYSFLAGKADREDERIKKYRILDADAANAIKTIKEAGIYIVEKKDEQGNPYVEIPLVDEGADPVIRLIEAVVKAANKLQIDTSLCGEAITALINRGDYKTAGKIMVLLESFGISMVNLRLKASMAKFDVMAATKKLSEEVKQQASVLLNLKEGQTTKLKQAAGIIKGELLYVDSAEDLISEAVRQNPERKNLMKLQGYKQARETMATYGKIVVLSRNLIAQTKEEIMVAFGSRSPQKDFDRFIKLGILKSLGNNLYYWTNLADDETLVEQELSEMRFSEEEIMSVMAIWKKAWENTVDGLERRGIDWDDLQYAKAIFIDGDVNLEGWDVASPKKGSVDHRIKGTVKGMVEKRAQLEGKMVTIDYESGLVYEGDLDVKEIEADIRALPIPDQEPQVTVKDAVQDNANDVYKELRYHPHILKMFIDNELDDLEPAFDQYMNKYIDALQNAINTKNALKREHEINILLGKVNAIDDQEYGLKAYLLQLIKANRNLPLDQKVIVDKTDYADAKEAYFKQLKKNIADMRGRLKTEDYIRDLFLNKMIGAIQAHDGKTVIHTTASLTSDDFYHMAGGFLVEPMVPNPNYGYRGAARAIGDMHFINRLELEAFREIHDNPATYGLSEDQVNNFGLQITELCGTQSAAIMYGWKYLLEAMGLFPHDGLQIGVSISTPSDTLQVDKYLEIFKEFGTGLSYVTYDKRFLGAAWAGVDLYWSEWRRLATEEEIKRVGDIAVKIVHGMIEKANQVNPEKEVVVYNFPKDVASTTVPAVENVGQAEVGGTMGRWAYDDVTLEKDKNTMYWKLTLIGAKRIAKPEMAGQPGYDKDGVEVEYLENGKNTKREIELFVMPTNRMVNEYMTATDKNFGSDVQVWSIIGNGTAAKEMRMFGLGDARLRTQGPAGRKVFVRGEFLDSRDITELDEEVRLKALEGALSHEVFEEERKEQGGSHGEFKQYGLNSNQVRAFVTALSTRDKEWLNKQREKAKAGNTTYIPWIGNKWTPEKVALQSALSQKKISSSTYDNVTLWLTPSFASQEIDGKNVGDAIRDLISQQKWQELEDRFFKVNSFGTAGVRGNLTLGSTHFNKINLGIGVEAHARYIMSEYEKDSRGKEKAVVLAYDSRHGSRDQEIGGPGYLVQYAASIYAAHGIKVYLFDDVAPTPELSFAINESSIIRPFAGGVFTASHNPSTDNGFKPYDYYGGQVVHSRVADLAKGITDYAEVKVGNYDALLASGVIQIIGEEIDKEYIKKENQNGIWLDEQGHFRGDKIDLSLTVAFSPLNGTAQRLFSPVLGRRGFNVTNNLFTVPEQGVPDGNFTTCPSPNPEKKEALDKVIALANEKKADIAVATDPDADRLGVGIRLSEEEQALYKDNADVKDGYYLLSGNMQLVVLTDYILSQLIERDGSLPMKSVVGKTIVSSPQMKLLVDAYRDDEQDISMFEPHVGFKFFGEKLAKYSDIAFKKAQENGEFVGRTYNDLTKKERERVLSQYAYYFIFGGEESYGSLIGDFVKDKDAITVGAMFVELAGYWKKQGKTVTQRIEELYRQYGYSKEVTISNKFAGAKGNAVIRETMADFRKTPLTQVAGKDVIAVMDYQIQKKSVDGKTVIVGQRTALDPITKAILFKDEAPTELEQHTGYMSVKGVEVPLFWHVDYDLVAELAQLGSADVVMYVLADGSKVILRPSGTEPVIKYYVLALGTQDPVVRGTAQDKQAVDEFFNQAKKELLMRGAVPAVTILGDEAPQQERSLYQEVMNASKALSSETPHNPWQDAMELHAKLTSTIVTEAETAKALATKVGSVANGSFATNGGKQGYYTSDAAFNDAFLTGVMTWRKLMNAKNPQAFIKMGIGGQHTPMQGSIDLFDASGTFVTAYELGVDYRQMLIDIKNRLGIKYSQISLVPSSKSGTTDETMRNFELLFYHLMILVGDEQGLTKAQAEAVADSLVAVMNTANKDFKGSGREHLYQEVSLDALFDKLNQYGGIVSRQETIALLNAVIGNMLFETTPDFTKSRLASFLNSQLIQKDLADDAKPMVIDMFDNVGGRWTIDLHNMMLIAKAAKTDEEAERIARRYWELRRDAILAANSGDISKSVGLQLVKTAIENSIQNLVLVVPQKAFWLGKGLEQNSNESLYIRVNGIPAPRLIVIAEENWAAQRGNYLDKKANTLLIPLGDRSIDTEGFMTFPIALPMIDNDQATQEEKLMMIGEISSVFYTWTSGMGNYLTAELINQTLAGTGKTIADIDFADLTKEPAVLDIFKKWFYLYQPYVEGGKAIVDTKTVQLQKEIASGNEEAIRDDYAARVNDIGNIHSNISEIQALQSVSNLKDLAKVLQVTRDVALRDGKEVVPLVYLAGTGFVDIREHLIKAGYPWVYQGTSDQHINVNYLMSNTDKYVPLFISFLPSQEVDQATALPALFAKDDKDQIGAYHLRDLFAEAIYQYWMQDEEAKGKVAGNAVFVRLHESEEALDLFTEAVTDERFTDSLDAVTEGYAFTVLKDAVAAMTMKADLNQVKPVLEDMLHAYTMYKGELSYGVQEAIIDGLREGVEFNKDTAKRIGAPRVALAISSWTLADMTAAQARELKNAFVSGAYEKLLVYVESTPGMEVSEQEMMNAAAELVDKKLGIIENVQLVKPRFLTTDIVDYSFLGKEAGYFDAVHIMTQVRAAGDQDMSRFEKELDRVKAGLISNRVRIIEGLDTNALEFSNALATVKSLFVTEGALAEIGTPEFTDEAIAKLGFYLLDESAVNRLMKTGAFIAAEISKQIKDKMDAALRLRVIEMAA